MSQPALDLGLDEAVDPTYSVAELSDAVNGVLARSFGEGVWVRGEIQGWSDRGPHAYFKLVEQTDTGKAALSVSFFAPARARLRPAMEKNRLRLVDGMKVRIFGRLDLFAQSGQLSLKMSGIDPRFTLGDLTQQRDEAVRRLVASGLYDANRQCALPPVPLRVGVVTSVGSAAWADFTHELQRSKLGFQLRVIDVRVQGDQAVRMITTAIATLAAQPDIDIVAVVRGGGARSELATFDHEAIATAIARSRVPVFTGLGHEIDRCVADEVAHTALKTPTACAAALVERVVEFQQRVDEAWSTLNQLADARLAAANVRLLDVANGIRHRVVAAIERSDERLTQRVGRLHTASFRITERANDRLDAARSAIGRTPRRLDDEWRHLDAATTRLRLLDPANTLARGWSISRGADGRVVRDAAQLVVGATLVTTFAHGTATSRVEATEQHPDVSHPSEQIQL